MNNYQKSKLTSLKLVVTESKNALDVVATIPYFSNGIDRLQEITSEIDSLNMFQGQDLTGITEDKNELLNQTIDLLIEVAGAVHSYAAVQGNKTLQALVDYRPRKIAKMDQTELVGACGQVLAEAKKIPDTDLTAAGLGADELAQFETSLARLKATLSLRREAGIDQSGTTKRIAALFAEAAELKKNTLDRLAPQFQRKAPEFYDKYKAASNVIYRHSSAKTAVTDELKG